MTGSDKEVSTVPVAPREKTEGRRAVASKAVKYDMVRNFKFMSSIYPFNLGQLRDRR